MIDRGLLLTLVVMGAGLLGLVRLAPPRTMARNELLDRVSLPVFVGMAAARLAAVGLDDPSAMRRLGDVMLVRGGMELWVGLAAGSLTVVASRAQLRTTPTVAFLADLAPYILWALAIYEGTCVLREGCFGPTTAFGFRPAGVGYAQLPIGLIVGFGIAVVGVVVRRLAPADPPTALVLAVGGLAAGRSIAGFWLPRIGDALTRQHRQSLVVFGLTVLVGSALVLLRRSGSRRSRRPAPTVSRSTRQKSGKKVPSSVPTEENPQCS